MREPSCTITVYWNSRRKVWDILATNTDSGQRPHWTWNVSADSQVDLDAGTGWLLMSAVRDALEARLM